MACRLKEAKQTVERVWGMKLTFKKHPLDALSCQPNLSNLERHCLMQLVLLETDDVMPPSETLMMTMIANFEDLNQIFGDRMRTTLKGLTTRTPFTYQYVQRETARPGNKIGRSVVNGEVVRRVFIALPNASSALHFVDSWMYAQRRSSANESTCLLECGTHDHTLRKWVLDVDASVAELKKKPSLWPGDAIEMERIKEELHRKTMQMAMNVCNGLFKLGFLYKPCHFSVTSRHSAKKMSWHVTLNALGTHDQWRKALSQMESANTTKASSSADDSSIKTTIELGEMYEFVDKSTKNNSKSQYMQVRGSTKVAAGTKADGNCFKDVGVFDANGKSVSVPIERYSTLFYAATSVVIHDPWSLPFKQSSIKEPEETTTKKRKQQPSSHHYATEEEKSKKPRMTMKDEESSTPMILLQPITNWDSVPQVESTWMRGLVERKDGSTRLVTIPSMVNAQYMCEAVTRALNSGKGVLKVYAKVLNPVLCPKHLKASQQVYRHGSNHCMLAVVEESHFSCKKTSFRMFMRCFSDKCKQMKCTHCSSGGWVELAMHDFLMARAIMLHPPHIHIKKEGPILPCGIIKEPVVVGIKKEEPVLPCGIIKEPVVVGIKKEEI